MTTRLYLLRHGIAVPHGAPGIADDDRPLTSKGEDRVEMIARGLDHLSVKVDRIVTSPLPRARRTAEIVARVLELENRLEEHEVLRPRSSAETIRDWLKVRDEENLMLVGHNPNLTELLALLLGFSGEELPFELKKGGIAELKFAGEQRFSLQWLATPRLLRKLRG